MFQRAALDGPEAPVSRICPPVSLSISTALALKTVNCQLCQRDTELQNSHIIPEFIYTPLYDEKHRFHVLSNLPAKKNAKEQKGLREPLLCKDCETHISRYERYASLVFLGRAKVTSKREGKLVHLAGLKYACFKLFALSVLWRAGVSSLKVFEQVSLGPHEMQLRRMLQDDDPGPSAVYPFMMCPVVHENEVQTDFIMQPTCTRAEGHFGYRFVFGGVAWIYIVSSHSPPKNFRAATLSEEGSTTMLISDMGNMPFIAEFIKELNAAGKIPEATC